MPILKKFKLNRIWLLKATELKYFELFIMVGGNILTVDLEAVLIETQYIVLIPREKIFFFKLHISLNFKQDLSWLTVKFISAQNH